MGRKPTEREISEAIRYMENEFVLDPDVDGRVHLDSVHWIEGLAYGPGRGYAPEPHHVAQAREVMHQLTDAEWVGLADAADHERGGQLMQPLYRTP